MPTQFLYMVNVLGTFAFAVSGAFLAMEKKLDPFGVLVIAFVTAIGGGTLRDVLIGNLPVGWLQHGTSIIVIFSAAVLAMLLGGLLKQLNTALFLFDAMGLGLFTVVGIEIAAQKQFSPAVCVALGTITACFGGVIRDVLLNDVPLLFRKEIYAMACIIGGACYFLFQAVHLDAKMGRIICIGVIFAVRVVAFRYKLSLPRFYDPKTTP